MLIGYYVIELNSGQPFWLFANSTLWMGMLAWQVRMTGCGVLIQHMHCQTNSGSGLLGLPFQLLPGGGA
jgi:hypothetical protein